MNIAKQLEATTHLPIEWNRETVSLEVYAERITSESLSRLAEVFGGVSEGQKPSEQLKSLPGVFDSLCAAVSTSVKNWDVDWNGEPFPPTLENLRRLPIDFLMACVNGILGLWQGNPTSAENSDSSSAPQAKEQIS